MNLDFSVLTRDTSGSNEMDSLCHYEKLNNEDCDFFDDEINSH